MSNIPDTYPGYTYQPLFDHMMEQHELVLLTSEMQEIIELCRQIIALENNQ